MDDGALFRLFRDIKTWKRQGERAPHKPLVLLYALAKLQQGQERLVYPEIEDKLKALLVQFGPPNRDPRPHYPFWRLRNDNIWTIEDFKEAGATKSGDASLKSLREQRAVASLTPMVRDALKANPSLLATIAQQLLYDHFPPSLHEDIAAEAGLELAPNLNNNQQRNTEFREKVLTAYEYRCTICGYDIRFGPRSIGLEAAHVKWHSQGGEETVDNGLALCVLHHKLFDYGAFRINDSYRTVLSDKVCGNTSFNAQLLQFHGKAIRFPQSEKHLPHFKNLHWHHREVFRGEDRCLDAVKAVA